MLAEIAELESRRQELDDRRGHQQTEVEDLGREQQKADRDVENVKQRRQRDQQRLDSGQVSDAKQMQAIQHEIQSLDRRISDLEDVELEVMDRLETAQTALTETERQLGEVDAELQTKAGERDEAYAEIDREATGKTAERAEVAPRVPDDLVALYDKLRPQFGGVAVGALKQGRCEGCRLDVGQAEMRRLKTLPADEVVRCEECNRILVRTPESGL